MCKNILKLIDEIKIIVSERTGAKSRVRAINNKKKYQQ